jgi:hypothetical protein
VKALEMIKQESIYSTATDIELTDIHFEYDYNKYIFTIRMPGGDVQRYIKAVNLPSRTVLFGNNSTVTFSMLDTIPCVLERDSRYIYIEDSFYRYFVNEPMKIAANQHFTKEQLLRKSYNIPLDILYITGSVGFIDYGIQDMRDRRWNYDLEDDKLSQTDTPRVVKMDIGMKAVWSDVASNEFKYQIMGSYAESIVDPVTGEKMSGFLRVIDLGNRFRKIEENESMQIKYNVATGFFIEENYETPVPDKMNIIIARDFIRKYGDNKEYVNIYNPYYILDKEAANYVISIYINKGDAESVNNKLHYIVDVNDAHLMCKSIIIFHKFIRYFNNPENLMDQIMSSYYIDADVKSKFMDDELTTSHTGERSKYWEPGFKTDIEYLEALNKKFVEGIFSKIKGAPVNNKISGYSINNKDPTLFGGILDEELFSIANLKAEMDGWSRVRGISPVEWLKIKEENDRNNKYLQFSTLEEDIRNVDTFGLFPHIEVSTRLSRNISKLIDNRKKQLNLNHVKKFTSPSIGTKLVLATRRIPGMNFIWEQTARFGNWLSNLFKSIPINIAKLTTYIGDIYKDYSTRGQFDNNRINGILDDIKKNQAKFTRIMIEVNPEFVSKESVEDFTDLTSFLNTQKKFYKQNATNEFIALINRMSGDPKFINVIPSSQLGTLGFTPEEILEFDNQSITPDKKIKLIESKFGDIFGDNVKTLEELRTEINTEVAKIVDKIKLDYGGETPTVAQKIERDLQIMKYTNQKRLELISKKITMLPRKWLEERIIKDPNLSVSRIVAAAKSTGITKGGKTRRNTHKTSHKTSAKSRRSHGG